MALEISNNAQFNQFVQFAQSQIQAGREKAIARESGQAVGAGPLAGRTIVAATGDWVGKWFRSGAAGRTNNIARDLFNTAVIEMF